ncbi:MAG: sigma-54-dependent Fis family transcriptional regulator [Alicyclobacillaceae bacterium]|nr:sigma-54-dependent Fis family transcriptional regulator [Alicyclobacillaceae bacterium]
MDAPLLYRTWKRFVREGTVDPSRLEKVVLDSWLRSRDYGVNPLRERGQVVLTPEELGARRRKYQVAIKEIESFVHKGRDAIFAHRMIVLFADPEGFILTQSGHPDTLRQAARIEFMPGADWSERAVGTNAIGTALATQSAVYVEGYQHYVVATHPWCCAAVPLRGRDGALLGVLNVSGPVEAAHPYLLSVVATMGIHIEQQIHRAQPGDVLDMPNEPAFEGIVGHSESFRNALHLAEKASQVDYPVCLFGESGTGKELLARYIHRLSSRRNGPFVALNCGSVSAQLLESELFGYEEGAFTGAKKGGYCGKLRLADGGTLFLDEIGEMPQDMQVALLRFLQEQTVLPLGSRQEIRVNARLIAATHRDLRELVRQGQFREDLFYRIHVLPIRVPPLRERKEDIPALVEHFLRECGMDKKVTPEGLRLLQAYDWPGNIRELRNVLLSAAVFHDSREIGPDVLAPLLGTARPTKKPLSAVTDARAEAVVKTLRETNGNIAAAARRLGVSRSTLYRWMKQN